MKSNQKREFTRRNIAWLKAAQKDFQSFPIYVQEKISTSLTLVADGMHPENAKPLKGLDSGIFEISLKYHKDAYRVIYGIKISEKIWIIHAFKKKSKSGKKTPKSEIDLIKRRIKMIKEIL